MSKKQRGAICGGIIPYSMWIRMSDRTGVMLCLVRKRVNVRGHYKYKIIDPLGDRWWWEGERK